MQRGQSGSWASSAGRASGRGRGGAHRGGGEGAPGGPCARPRRPAAHLPAPLPAVRRGQHRLRGARNCCELSCDSAGDSARGPHGRAVSGVACVTAAPHVCQRAWPRPAFRPRGPGLNGAVSKCGRRAWASPRGQARSGGDGSVPGRRADARPSRLWPPPAGRRGETVARVGRHSPSDTTATATAHPRRKPLRAPRGPFSAPLPPSIPPGLCPRLRAAVPQLLRGVRLAPRPLHAPTPGRRLCRTRSSAVQSGRSF